MDKTLGLKTFGKQNLVPNCQTTLSKYYHACTLVSGSRVLKIFVDCETNLASLENTISFESLKQDLQLNVFIPIPQSACTCEETECQVAASYDLMKNYIHLNIIKLTSWLKSTKIIVKSSC